MSEIFRKFQKLTKISEKLFENIQTFHVFDDENSFNCIFIKSDDKVFGLGFNSYGCCGLGHNHFVEEPQLIPELCHKNFIIDFRLKKLSIIWFNLHLISLEIIIHFRVNFDQTPEELIPKY